MKALTIVRDVVLASAVILVVAGICAGPTIYSEISKTMREDAGAIARLIEETLEEQKQLLQSQKEFPPEESGSGEYVVIRETKATLSDFQKAGQTLSTLIFKWMTISILIVMAILCALAFIRFVLFAPGTRP